MIVESTGKHVYAIEQERVDATCEADGYVIKACGCGATEKTVIPATGHNYEAVVAAPTCTEAGYTTYTCKHDSEHTYTADEVAALGHTEAEAVVENLVGSDLTTAGSYDVVIYCSVCNVEISRENTVLPALNVTDYTTETTVADGVVTTVFTFNSDVVEYSASVTSNNYLTVNDGVYSQYDVAKLNSETITVSYDDENGYIYDANSATTLTGIVPTGANLTILGEVNINTKTATWLISGVTITIGSATKAANVTVTNTASNIVKITKAAHLVVADLGKIHIVGTSCTNSIYIGINPDGDNVFDTSSIIIDGVMTVDHTIAADRTVEDNAGGEFGFDPAIFIRSGTLNAAKIETNNIQIGSLEGDGAYGILNTNNMVAFKSRYWIVRYVFAKGEINAKPSGDCHALMYVCSTNGAGSIVDIRKGMTITVETNESIKYGYLISQEYRSCNYRVYIEDGATFNFPEDATGKSGFTYGFMCAYQGTSHLYTYSNDTVKVLIDGVETEVLVLNDKDILSIAKGGGHNANQSVLKDYATEVVYPDIAEGTVLTATGTTLQLHNYYLKEEMGTWIQATYTVDGVEKTVYYKVVVAE